MRESETVGDFALRSFGEVWEDFSWSVDFYFTYRFKEDLGFLAYRFLEFVDGERGIQLVPYRIAQPIKISILNNLIGGDQ